jgi:hypothetical protein
MPRQGITPIDVLADNPRYRTRYGAGNVPVERKINGSVRTEESPPSVPARAAPALIWRAVYITDGVGKRVSSPNSIRSGPYTISRVIVAGKERFELWKQNAEWQSALGSSDTAQAAKDLAEKDFAKSSQKG